MGVAARRDRVKPLCKPNRTTGLQSRRTRMTCVVDFSRARGRAELDLNAAGRIPYSAPPKRWVSYGDAAVGCGRCTRAAQGRVSWTAARDIALPNVHRISSRTRDQSRAGSCRRGLPAKTGEVEEPLLEEGVHITGGRADPDQRGVCHQRALALAP